jgi:hypothetical protein
LVAPLSSHALEEVERSMKRRLMSKVEQCCAVREVREKEGLLQEKMSLFLKSW